MEKKLALRSFHRKRTSLKDILRLPMIEPWFCFKGTVQGMPVLRHVNSKDCAFWLPSAAISPDIFVRKAGCLGQPLGSKAGSRAKLKTLGVNSWQGINQAGERNTLSHSQFMPEGHYGVHTGCLLWRLENIQNDKKRLQFFPFYPSSALPILPLPAPSQKNTGTGMECCVPSDSWHSDFLLST